MKLFAGRILLFLVIGFSLSVTLAQAASAPEIAVYRSADRQAQLEKGAKAEGEFV